MHKAALILSMGAATATLCLGAAVVLAGGTATDAAGSTAIAAVTPERAAVLEHIVIQDCGSCHGLTMKGGLGAAITPADLAGRDPEGLAEIILDGLPGTAMPPWRPLLTEAEARWIADYLLTEKEAE
ncbi:MAG: cytochrome c [Paracoccus sp. (in: a-proteobacteria)]|nr:cytochrome c [Paracoccus sp. (in: a-proteobacteria)]